MNGRLWTPESNRDDENITPDQYDDFFRDKGLKKFDVRHYEENGALKQAVFIDGICLDYEIDITAFRQASKMGPEYKKAMQVDIVNHFVSAVSEMVGRRVTIPQIEAARKTGWI